MSGPICLLQSWVLRIPMAVVHKMLLEEKVLSTVWVRDPLLVTCKYLVWT